MGSRGVSKASKVWIVGIASNLTIKIVLRIPMYLRDGVRPSDLSNRPG
jgi:hypothetical protein